MAPREVKLQLTLLLLITWLQSQLLLASSTANLRPAQTLPNQGLVSASTILQLLGHRPAAVQSAPVPSLNHNIAVARRATAATEHTTTTLGRLQLASAGTYLPAWATSGSGSSLLQSNAPVALPHIRPGDTSNLTRGLDASAMLSLRASLIAAAPASRIYDDVPALAQLTSSLTALAPPREAPAPASISEMYDPLIAPPSTAGELLDLLSGVAPSGQPQQPSTRPRFR